MEHSLELPPAEGEAAGNPRGRHLPVPASGAATAGAKARYHSLFSTMAQALCLIEKVATAPGQPSTYRYVAINPAFTRHSGLPDVTGRTLRQVVPGVEMDIVAVYDDALASGQPHRVEE